MKKNKSKPNILDEINAQAESLFLRGREIHGMLLSENKFSQLNRLAKTSRYWPSDYCYSDDTVASVATPYGSINIIRHDYEQDGIFVVDTFRRDSNKKLHIFDFSSPTQTDGPQDFLSLPRIFDRSMVKMGLRPLPK